MDFTSSQTSTELDIHTHVPLCFHLWSRVWSATVWNEWKGDNALHQWLEKISFLRRAKEVSFKCDKSPPFFRYFKYFADLMVNVRIIENMKVSFVFLKLSMGYVVLELCLVYNIDIVFLKVSIKYWNGFYFLFFLSVFFASSHFRCSCSSRSCLCPALKWTGFAGTTYTFLSHSFTRSFTHSFM